MLKELRIKNLAIIEDLTVRFEKGLNILSGETGAGKSIIVDALGLALGNRAQSDLLKTGEKEAVVQAYFELDDYSSLPDLGIDVSEGLVLRRMLSSNGKSRAYINDSMVTMQSLSEIGKSLVDIHSQHEHQSLLTVAKQRTLLDSYGKLQSDAEKVGSLFREMQTLKDEYSEVSEKIKERAHRLDLLKFQINEINVSSLTTNEKEELEEEKKILANQTKLNELTNTAYALLYEAEGSCSERLSSVISQLREILSIDSSIEDTLKLLESAKPLIDDASINMRGYRERYDFEPGRLETVEDRLELIKRLERKYGSGIETILKYRDDAEEEMKGLEMSDEKLISVEKELALKKTALQEAALSLSEKRKKTARKIESLIKENLRELAMANAEFRIDVKQEAGVDEGYLVSLHGIDRIEFLFSANPGEPLKPLSKIISGGELSRVMLALKSILAEVDNIPVLIFDEVDAGIGGKTAGSVGKKLDLISKKHQLLCITHLPQIAKYGGYHLKIEKKNKNNKTFVDVKELSGKERQDEIARMLSGDLTEASLKHAEELLERNR
ncbi:MAG: DNA repair protein RecN [Nitrospirae bacterium GWC2_42_7]|nr:MAG: DNA repair protein RecN [Nitrospirae bacterium GWC2_42_7]